MKYRFFHAPGLGLGALCLGIALTAVIGCTAWEQRSGLTDREIRKLNAEARPIVGNPGIHYRQGLLYQSRNQHKLAVDEFRRVLFVDPENIRAMNAMAVSCDNLGDFEQAEFLYQSALALDPGLDYVHNNLGYSYLLQGKIGPAIQSFEQALALAPENITYRNNLGMAYAQAGEFEQALTQFEPRPEPAQPAPRPEPVAQRAIPSTPPPAPAVELKETEIIDVSPRWQAEPVLADLAPEQTMNPAVAPAPPPAALPGVPPDAEMIAQDEPQSPAQLVTLVPVILDAPVPLDPPIVVDAAELEEIVDAVDLVDTESAVAIQPVVEVEPLPIVPVETEDPVLAMLDTPVSVKTPIVADAVEPLEIIDAVDDADTEQAAVPEPMVVVNAPSPLVLIENEAKPQKKVPNPELSVAPTPEVLDAPILVDMQVPVEAPVVLDAEEPLGIMAFEDVLENEPAAAPEPVVVSEPLPVVPLETAVVAQEEPSPSLSVALAPKVLDSPIPVDAQVPMEAPVVVDTPEPLEMMGTANAMDTEPAAAPEPVAVAAELSPAAPPETQTAVVQSAGQADPGRYAIQVGAYRHPQNARSMQERLRNNGYPAVIKKPEDTGLILVLVGSYPDRASASREAGSLARKEGIEAFPIQEEQSPAQAGPSPADSRPSLLAARPALNPPHSPVNQPLSPSLRILGTRDFLPLVPIEVLNGNGVRHMARRVGNFLETKGYNVAKVADADHFNHTQTVIFFQEGFMPMAEDLAAKIPGGGELRQISSMDPVRAVRVRMVIGRDLIQYDMAHFQGWKPDYL